MNQKTFIWLGMIICSFVVGLIPLSWGASLFSFDTFIFNGFGGLLGIYLGYKVSRYFR